MGYQAIAFDSYSTDPKGHIVGEVLKDVQTGKSYRFIQSAQDLAGDAMAAGQVITRKSATVVEGTNDVSTGLDATYPKVLGIAQSACPESTASVTYYCWVLIDGDYATVKTNGDDDIAVGVMLIPSTAVDGTCDSLPGTATNTADGVLSTIFGYAIAVDTDADNTVSARIFVKQ